MSKTTFGENLQKGPDHKGETTYVMYHGTTMKAARKIKRKGFIWSADGMLGPGVYVSRSFEKAACYPKGAKDQKQAVLKLSVRVGRVKKIDRQGHHLQKSWHQAGYDTAWVPPNCGMVKSGLQENCVWDPKRIRVLSIQNNTRESSDDESTDEVGDEEEDNDDDVPDTNSGEFTDEDEIAADGVSGEESSDSSDERSSRHSSDTSTDEYVNYTDDAFSGLADDRSSDHRYDDEASDEEGYRCDESTYDFTYDVPDTNSGEFTDEDEIAADGVSGEESSDSSDERSSRHSSDTSTDEYVNYTDDASSGLADDRSSDHRYDDEASDEEGMYQSTYDFTETNASESSDGEFSNEYSYESDEDY